MKISIYKLVNDKGIVEYVGQSKCPEYRFVQHTVEGVGWIVGKFIGRTDIHMEIIEYIDNKKEAWIKENEWQKFYGLETDREHIHGCTEEERKEVRKRQGKKTSETCSKRTEEQKEIIGNNIRASWDKKSKELIHKQFSWKDMDPIKKAIRIEKMKITRIKNRQNNENK